MKVENFTIMCWVRLEFLFHLMVLNAEQGSGVKPDAGEVVKSATTSIQDEALMCRFGVRAVHPSHVPRIFASATATMCGRLLPYIA